MAKLADAHGLGPCPERGVGSSPASGTAVNISGGTHKAEEANLKSSSESKRVETRKIETYGECATTF